MTRRRLYENAPPPGIAGGIPGPGGLRLGWSREREAAWIAAGRPDALGPLVEDCPPADAMPGLAELARLIAAAVVEALRQPPHGPRPARN